MKYRRQSRKPIIFFENAAPFKVDVLIAAGAKQADLIAYAKKHKFRKNYIKFLEKENFYKNNAMRGNGGVIGKAIFAEEAMFAGILLKPYYDSWEYWECLMHELHHMVFFLARHRGFHRELEAQAYLFETLFNRIRRRLMGIES